MNVVDGTTVAVCEYCGTRQTLPKINDEQRAAAFNRGDHFRKVSEFDKALSVYERIIAEDDTDAEAHWCAALSRYGIEYVKDPASGKYIPTCHRASYTNFLDDVDYQAAVSNADPVAREQYEQDGRIIAEVQRNIIETVNKEAPFDVFICYKESDDRGQRTLDSTLAQDIYYRLTDQGYRVFFSRITLEDKAGQQYEPYIFAALHSAKVMIVIGTRPEYMNAVWVKNEWSRYLALMKNDRSRLLIPCYRDMDPYDMPEQLSVLQSYDMSRIGFIQDLIRGISKVLEAWKPKEKETVIVQTASGNTTLDAQIKRGNIALEDGDFQSADSYFDHALDIDPESAEAYFGKALAKEQCRTADQFVEKHRSTDNRKAEEISVPRNVSEAVKRSVKNYAVPNYLDKNTLRRLYKTAPVIFRSETAYLEQKLKTENENFTNDKWLSKAFRYAKGNFRTKLDDIRNTILNGIQSNLNQARAADEAEQQRIMQQYMQDFQRSEQEARKQYNQALQKREADYQSACIEMSRADDITKCEKVISDFQRIGLEYKDVAARVGYLENARTQFQQEKQRQDEEQQKRAATTKKKKILALILSLITVSSVVLAYIFIIKPAQKYKEAENFLLAGDYDSAITAFQELGNYKDCSERLRQAYYSKGEKLLSTHDFDLAIDAFTNANDLEKVRQVYNEKGESLLSVKAYDRAIEAFNSAKEPEMVKQAYYVKGKALLSEQNYDEAYKIFSIVDGYSDSSDILISIKDGFTIVAVAAGGYHTVGLRSNGTVVVVGMNGYGQSNVSNWRNIITVTAGSYHTVGLKSDGTVVAAGNNDFRQCDVSDWRGIVAVSAGNSHTIGLKSDGTVVAAGSNGSGQCDVSDWRDIVAVSAGNSYTIGLKSDGTVVAAGSNSFGQCNVFEWREIIAVDSGTEGSHTVGLKSDGTVVVTGNNGFRENDVSDWRDIIAVAAGKNYTIGLRSDRTVIATGSNGSGQCDVSEWNIQTN